MLQIQNEELFKKALLEGINLITGAGFSVRAFNKFNETLPLTPVLIEKICQEYDLKQHKTKSLAWLSKYIKRTKANEYRLYLKDLYKVASFNELYNYLELVNIRSILTTNIDDLPEKIFNNFKGKFLNDTFLDGRLDSRDTDYYKLHGSVTYSYNTEMLFSTEELSGAFLRDSSFWKAAQIKHFSYPSLFWGININDSNIIDLINRSNYENRPCAYNWILILPDEKFDTDAEMFQEEGFYVIRGNTTDLLNYFALKLAKNSTVTKQFERLTTVSEYFAENYVEYILKKSHPARPVKLFYEGDEPRWSDIVEKKLYKLSYYGKILNDILKFSHIHITGIAGSGKTTLLMQLAAAQEIIGSKFYFEHISILQAKKFLSEIQFESTIYIFIDNLSSNLEAFDMLKEDSRIKIISAERDINTFNLKGMNTFTVKASVVDISDIDQSEVNHICKYMQKAPYVYRNEKVSLFEIVFKLWFNSSAKERVKEIIKSLPKDLLEFYTINTYARYTGISCSLDMLIAYYYDTEVNYEAIYSYVDKLRSVIDDANYYEDDTQDFFTLRSKVFSEMSIEVIDNATLSKVISTFHKNISFRMIHNFKMFKRKAWDADVICKAFPDVEKGKIFYNQQIANNNDYYIKHQYAIYLFRLNQIDEAWRMIEEAFNDSNGSIFSIRNTHATYLFERNIDKNEDEYNTVKSMLEKSFEELEKCLDKDSSKSYHAITYARHAIRYHERYKSKQSMQFVTYARNYISKEINSKEYKPKKIFYALKNLHSELGHINNAYQ